MSSPLRIRLICLICFAAVISACSSAPDQMIFPGVHKLNMQQGNIIDQDKLDQLEVGMSRAQAQFVMGTPLVSDTFDLDRWDYVYELRRADGEIIRRTVTLRFSDGVLTQIRGAVQPSEDSPPS